MWEMVSNYEVPVGWETNTDTSLTRLEKDSDAVEGEYALKLLPASFSAWTVCQSYALREVTLDDTVGENKSLTFYAKSIPEFPENNENVYLIVRAVFYVEDTIPVSEVVWKAEEAIEEYTKVDIPITNANVNKIYMSIVGGAWPDAGDGCNDPSYSWIDAIKIEESQITKTKDVGHSDIKIYPNPTNGVLNVDASNLSLEKYNLYSIDGLLIEVGDIFEGKINLNTNKKGMFILQLTSTKQLQNTMVKLVVLY